MPQTNFQQTKSRILQSLQVSPEDYTDLSPKGSVDENIKELISLINQHPHYVTSSSCSGRVSVYVEGKKKPIDSTELVASAGGKGGGGWLLVEHDPINLASEEWRNTDLLKKFGFQKGEEDIPEMASLIHVKFEAMILHLLAESTEFARLMLKAALESGFRESGAMSLPTSSSDSAALMVAVRSNGLAFDSIIGYEDEQGCRYSLVDSKYILNMLAIANQRFVTNKERTLRFQEAASRIPTIIVPPQDMREDPEIRKQRKKAEGLARQQALKESQDREVSSETTISQRDLDVAEMFDG